MKPEDDEDDGGLVLDDREVETSIFDGDGNVLPSPERSDAGSPVGDGWEDPPR